MTEFLWYTRLTVWAGALILIAQAVTGRDVSFMTLVGVVVLSVGFVAFLAELGRESLVGWGSRIVAPVSDEGGAAPRPAVGTTSPSADEGPPMAVPAPSSSPPGADVDRTAARKPVPTLEIREGGRFVGASCPGCDRAMEPGQIAAVCPICGELQHASCWIDNRFSCSTPGCHGRGSLAEPDHVFGDPDGPDSEGSEPSPSPDPFGGPSKP